MVKIQRCPIYFAILKKKEFVAISSSEHFHAIDVLSRFSSLCSIWKFVNMLKTKLQNDLSSNDFQEIFLDNMINGLFD